MNCPYCLESIIDGAKLCRFCGKTQPAEKARRNGRLVDIVFWCVCAAFVAFMVLWATGPRTVGDVAKLNKEQCIAAKANGNWTASSGVTLESFCEAAGDLQALERDRKDHPERY